MSVEREELVRLAQRLNPAPEDEYLVDNRVDELLDTLRRLDSDDKYRPDLYMQVARSAVLTLAGEPHPLEAALREALGVLRHESLSDHACDVLDRLESILKEHGTHG